MYRDNLYAYISVSHFTSSLSHNQVNNVKSWRQNFDEKNGLIEFIMYLLIKLFTAVRAW